MAEDLSVFFRSLIDQDDMPVVICDIADTIVYMNPSAEEHFSDDLGGNLVGRSVLDCHPRDAAEKIQRVVKWFSESPDNNIVHTMFIASRDEDIYMVALRDSDRKLIGYYEKHVSRRKDAAPMYRM